MNTHTHTHAYTWQPSQNVMGFSGPYTQRPEHSLKEDNSDLVNILEISKGIVRLSCPRDLSYCPGDSNLYASGVKTRHLASFESLF